MPRTTPVDKPYWLFLACLLLVVSSVDALGGWLTQQGLDWYATLHRAPWNPPDWLFAPAWTVLYALTAVAPWLLVRSSGGFRGNGAALALWSAQLLCNAVWSYLFFYLRAPSLALADLFLLNALLAATIVLFRRKSTLAAAMLVPVLVWTLYALSLNAAIVWLN